MANVPDVHICEAGPRDGLQNLDIFVPTEAKCALGVECAGLPSQAAR